MIKISKIIIVCINLLLCGISIFNLGCNYKKLLMTDKNIYLKEILEDSIFGNNIKLTPANTYNEILRYYQTTGYGGDFFVLSVEKLSKDYKLQFISSILDLDFKKKISIHEKVMSKDRFLEIGKKLMSLNDFPITLDSINSSIDGPYFYFVFKNDKDLIGFTGIPSVYSKDENKEMKISSKKKELLKLVCMMINETYKFQKVKYIEKPILNKSKDSASYSVFLTNSYFSSDLKVLLDGKQKILNSLELKLSTKDTIGLKNRLNIVETEWDGSVNVF